MENLLDEENIEALKDEQDVWNHRLYHDIGILGSRLNDQFKMIDALRIKVEKLEEGNSNE